MDRAKVICHMMTTIDGKISIDFDGNADYMAVGDEYDRRTFSYGQAYGCGRATFQQDNEIDFSNYKNKEVKYEDHVILPPAGKFLCVSFDRFGKLRWNDRFMSYAGHDSLILEVLTKQVAPEFLAYLDELEMPYMFAGEEDFDPALFLKKLKEDYGVETFSLCGGAEINAAFMKADLVDEISLVIGAAVDGNRQSLTFIGTEDTAAFPKYFKLKDVERLENNGVVLWYEKIGECS